MANALHGWLPNVIQAVQPWLSSSDIQVGARWANELQLQLRETSAGIICLTPENITAPWILFEVGALANTLATTYVCPYLFGFSPSELNGPLIQFQAALANQEGTKSLIYTLNRALRENSLNERLLDNAFDIWWPRLEQKLNSVAKSKELTSEIRPKSTLAGQTAAEEQRDNELHDLLRDFWGGRPDRNVTPTVTRPPKDRIFVVHGHNVKIKETVARFIEKVGLAAIILHEQPNEGRTIIEKFESLSEVDYAVVLFTADDEGGAKDNSAGTSLEARARQNVVFELGFFTAKLGRSRVSVLYEEGVAIPSDFSGILYIPIDQSGFWKFSLAKEFKTAGLHIDMNNAI